MLIFGNMIIKINSNFLRGLIGFIIGFLLIFAAMRYSDKLAADKPKPKRKVEAKTNKVYTQEVKNKMIPIVIEEKGSLQALKKVDIYSEVQGLLRQDNELVKPGKSYEEGNAIFSIDDGEFRASLIAQKSVLYNLLTQIMPDLKFDYPDVFSKWQNYLNGFDIQRSTPKLPAFSNDKEKYFINSKNIVTTYYNIKNLEEQHRKFNIYAPFNGIITEANAIPGSLVRPGQKLATILNPDRYELPVSINGSYADYIKVGKQVTLYNLDHSRKWNGKIARVNAVVDAETQGIQVYIQVSGRDLKEGMFLEASIKGKSIANGFELSRKLLVENNKTYVVKNGMLSLEEVEVAYFNQNSAIVTNLSDETLILRNPIPGAYDGMIVEISESSND